MSAAYSGLVAGSSITWKDSGGEKVLTLASLTHTPTGRQGDKSATLVDATKGMPEVLDVALYWLMASTGAAGDEIQVYIGESTSATAGTDNPGTLGGADASLSNPTTCDLQLNFVGAGIVDANQTTAAQMQRFRYKPINAYIIPVIVNAASQNLGAAGATLKLVITPYYRGAPIA